MFPSFSVRNRRKNVRENERCPSPRTRIFHPGGMKYSAFNCCVLIFILFSIILSRVPQLNFLPRRIPRVSINDTSRKRAHLLPVRPLSIIHVVRKLITRPIHCGFVNLFDGWIVPGACHPIPLCSPAANLPRSFVRILGNILSRWHEKDDRLPGDGSPESGILFVAETGEKRVRVPNETHRQVFPF